MYTNITHNDDICNYFLKNQQFIFKSLGNCRECRFQRAASVDNILLVYLKEVAAEKKYLPLAFKICRGIMSLEKKYGLERLVAACACASQSRRYGYQEVLDILEHGEDVDFMSSAETESDGVTQSTPAQHKNIRGREYYSNKSNSKKSENGNK